MTSDLPPTRRSAAPERINVPENGTTTDLSPTVFVLYGATGDLARRMVLPAFYQLAQHGLLPADWRLIGSGRGERSDEDFVDHVKGALEEFASGTDDGPWEEFSQRLRFAGGGFTEEDPGQLLDAVSTARKELGDEAP